ncbi:MAG TPA: response regulator transcription factor [Polyangiaceae bacterium]|nr:response regulator transcription factor [Polyangiaceae bacterium]
MASPKQVLVVDDERRIGEVVEYALSKEGYRVTLAHDGKHGLELFGRETFDLVVLDVMLPDVDGLEICRHIRARGDTPVLFLSARSDEVDKIVGLEIGGDDYLVKPFSPRELVARVRAVLRRSHPVNAKAEAASRLVGAGKLELDPERHEARYAGTRVQLTATEFALLVALFERPGVVLTRSQLMQRAYSTELTVTERTLDTHVRRIRAKFRGFGADPISTVHGVGYRSGDV